MESDPVAVAEKDLTGWYTEDQNPVRPGVYQTTVEELMRPDGRPMGSSYSRWNGESWERFRSWGEYHPKGGVNAGRAFLWRGVNKPTAMVTV